MIQFPSPGQMMQGAIPGQLMQGAAPLGAPMLVNGVMMQAMAVPVQGTAPMGAQTAPAPTPTPPTQAQVRELPVKAPSRGMPRLINAKIAKVFKAPSPVSSPMAAEVEP